MPRKKSTYAKISDSGSGRATGTPQSSKRAVASAGRAATPRTSLRASTIKKVAESKQKRTSGRGVKEKKNPWDDSDDDAAATNYKMIFSESDIESEGDYKPDNAAELSSNDSDFEFKDEISTTFREDSSETIFCPWAEMDSSKIPPLILPCSSSDLLIDKDHLFDAVEVYEILRTYGHTIQISPFLFEDFCSALRSSVQSKLLCEIHIALLKLLFRDDEDDQTLFCVQDTNSRFNLMLTLIEPMTFGEILREYAESDPSFSQEVLHILNTTNYPFVELDKRLVVLKFLCERILCTIVFRRLINRDNKIIHDEHCRDCGRQGDVLLCDGCEACYHLSCTNLTEVPRGKWLCQICEVHELNGVANCLMPGERDYRFSRRTKPLGFDRHGRIYWFLSRRLYIQDFENKELYYYSSLPQIYELMSELDGVIFEPTLFKALADLLPTIAEHMRITLELTDERAKNLQEKLQRDCPQAYLHVDNIHRMSQIIVETVEQPIANGVEINEKIENAKLDANDGKPAFVKDVLHLLKELLGIENGHLIATLWSGGSNESELLEYHQQLESEAAYAASVPTNGNVDPMDQFQLMLIENLQRGYRLGFSDAEYRNYVNYYSVSDFAKSPYARAKERDRRRYMNSRFSLTDEGEFSWICAKGRDCYGSENDVAKWIQFTLRRLIERLGDDLMHRLWRYDEKPRLQEYLQTSVTVDTLKYALLQFECAVRKPIFCTAWWNCLGHTRLLRLTSEERERRQKIDANKKKEEKILASADAHDEDFVWVKYSLYKNGPPRHYIWRQKDEQYRVNARDKMGGWLWISSTYKKRIVDPPKRPRLGINYLTAKNLLSESSDQKAHLLDKTIKFLSTRRMLNDSIEAARNANPPCYSPSCREVARGERTLISALCILDAQFRPCYSPSCPRHLPIHDTKEIVKAFKPFRPKPYVKKSNDEPLKPENIYGEGKAFPFPSPFDYKSKRSGKQSIFVLPKNSLRRLARQGGLNSATYVPGFHKLAKNNYQIWNYPCARPLFDNCWRYMTVTARSLHALALQLRIIYACIRWSDLEPAEPDDEDLRVWTHHPDCDEVRTLINHKEYPPDGYYEQYKIRVERYALQEDMQNGSAAGEDDSADYTTTSVKTLRKRKRNNRTVQEEVYVKRRRTAVEEKWIDGVELKLYEIAGYWAHYFAEKRRKFAELKQKQQQMMQQAQMHYRVTSLQSQPSTSQHLQHQQHQQRHQQKQQQQQQQYQPRAQLRLASASYTDRQPSSQQQQQQQQNHQNLPTAGRSPQQPPAQHHHHHHLQQPQRQEARTYSPQIHIYSPIQPGPPNHRQHAYVSPQQAARAAHMGYSQPQQQQIDIAQRMRLVRPSSHPYSPPQQQQQSSLLRVHPTQGGYVIARQYHPQQQQRLQQHQQSQRQ